MAYRKFNAGNLFTGYEMLGNEHVLITKEDGTIEGIFPFKDAGDDIEMLEGIVSPGFINCHCHLELSHIKGLIPERTGMIDFLLTVVKQRNVNPENIQQAIVDAEDQMRQSGIIAVGDICNTVDTIIQKRKRNIYYHNFIEAMGFVEETASKRFENSVEVFKQFAANHSLPIESNSIVPHAPYSVSEKLFNLIADFPGNHLLTIHNQESEAENEFLQFGTGDFLRLYAALGIDLSFYRPKNKRSLASFLHYFYKNQSMILVHNVATNQEDLNELTDGFWQMAAADLTSNHKLQNSELFFCLCPNANQYISGKLPDVNLLTRKNCTIVVGTDSLASNHQLDILEELKTLQQKFPHLATTDLLRWATLNGSYALQLETVTGSFEPGKRPGIVLIENIDSNRFTTESKSRRVL
jgi:cytosine/adenosine deaminase-related metal-dependent hydrolase